jgi:hypothetical protein
MLDGKLKTEDIKSRKEETKRVLLPLNYRKKILT